MDIKLLPLTLDDAASVTGVQLFNGSGVHLLAASGGELSVIPEGPGNAERVPAMQLGGGHAWDARQLDGGPLGGTFFTAVYVQAGSATSSIMSKTAKARSGTRLHQETFAVYVHPHYVKGKITTLPVTAIHLKGGRAQVVLFSYDPVAGAPTERPAGEPAALMIDARLLQDATGYWMFTLAPAESEAAPRETGTATRVAALLHAVRLDAELKPHGAASWFLAIIRCTNSISTRRRITRSRSSQPLPPAPSMPGPPLRTDRCPRTHGRKHDSRSRCHRRLCCCMTAFRNWPRSNV